MPSWCGVTFTIPSFVRILPESRGGARLGGRPAGAILVRIRVAEAELAAALGKQCTSYADRTRRLVPGLW
jgi:protein-S-isoprenylcysteine O-methyltransferase Ste14